MCNNDKKHKITSLYGPWSCVQMIPSNAHIRKTMIMTYKSWIILQLAAEVYGKQPIIWVMFIEQFISMIPDWSQFSSTSILRSVNSEDLWRIVVSDFCIQWIFFLGQIDMFSMHLPRFRSIYPQLFIFKATPFLWRSLFLRITFFKLRNQFQMKISLCQTILISSVRSSSPDYSCLTSDVRILEAKRF